MYQEKAWSIISKADATVKIDSDECIPSLQAALKNLPPDELVDFQDCMHSFLNSLNTPACAAACLIMECEYHEELFLRFRLWIIFQGRDRLEKTVRNPDSLADIALESGMHQVYEEALWLAGSLYGEKTGKDDFENRLTVELGSDVVSAIEDEPWAPDGEIKEKYAEEHFPKLSRKFLS